MERKHPRARRLPFTAIPVLLLAVLAWLAPLMAQHETTSPSQPSLLSCKLVFDADGSRSQSSEVPSLLEEEEPTEKHRLTIGSSSGFATIPTASSPVLPEATALPVESLLVFSALPRGPPARVS